VIRGNSRIQFASIALAILVGLTGTSVFGQTSKASLSEAVTGMRTQLPPTPSSGGITALEGPVNPKTYILGPGDRLEFDVWGPFESKFELTVAPDGQIAAPTVGRLNVSGLTLFKADSIFGLMSRASYPRTETALRLIAVRRMKASVSGAVGTPGTYELSATDRLSSLVNLAGGFLVPDEETKQKEALRELTVIPRSAAERRSLQQVREANLQRAQASLRHITITSRDGTVKSIDLQRFYAVGDLACNPILSDGDIVQAPLIDREIGVVNIFGAVKSPGEYEYRSGDRLRDLVELAGGFRDDALVQTITVIRFDKNGAKPVELTADLNDTLDRGIEIQSDDRIFIRKKNDFKQKFQVLVKGEVLYPGTYPIKEENTRLTDVVKACGGLTDRANLYSAKVLRRSAESIEDPEYERLKSLAVSEMTDMEAEYFKIRSREESPSVVVSFSELFVHGDMSQDILLQDKDEIEIPTLSPTVKVAGQVNSPGLVRYVEGMGYEYYIGKAGGYSWNARKGKMRLIKAHSGMWIKPGRKTPIEIGDTIFVPEKQETDWWALSKDMLLAVSQIATVLIMIRSL